MTTKPRALLLPSVIAKPQRFVARLVLADLVAKRGEGPLERRPRGARQVEVDTHPARSRPEEPHAVVERQHVRALEVQRHLVRRGGAEGDRHPLRPSRLEENRDAPQLDATRAPDHQVAFPRGAAAR